MPWQEPVGLRVGDPQPNGLNSKGRFPRDGYSFSEVVSGLTFGTMPVVAISRSLH